MFYDFNTLLNNTQYYSSLFIYILRFHILIFYDSNILWEGVLFSNIIAIFPPFSDSVLIIYDSTIPWEAVLLSKEQPL